MKTYERKILVTLNIKANNEIDADRTARHVADTFRQTPFSKCTVYSATRIPNEKRQVIF